MDTVAPLKQIRIKKNDNLPYFDSELRFHTNERNKIHSFALGFPKCDPIWEKFRAVRNFVSSMNKRKMVQFYSDKSLSAFATNQKYWDFYNSVIKTKKSSEAQAFANIIDAETNSSISTPSEIAKIFNRHFTNISCNPMVSDSESTSYINGCFLELKRSGRLVVPNEGFSFKQFSLNEVEKAIASLENNSSSGITEIPVKVIKHCSGILAPVLVTLFNHFIDSGSIPHDLKCAIAFPLFKKGDITNCDNYRGISVLSPFAKVFEKLIAAQITHYFVDNNLFCNAQHGFRSGRSCETALQTILEKWKTSVERKEIVLALFIDFKKAFDLVDPKLLLLKLFHYGFDNASYNLLNNYFSERNQITRIHKTLSEKSPIRLGVPQGSILGPLLFNIFINDLPIFLAALESILFADDTTLFDSDTSYSHLISRFREKFRPVNDWINHNKLFLNWSKTKFMLINNTKKFIINSKKMGPRKPKEIQLENNMIEVVKEFKLLGVTIDENLTFNTHISNLKSSVCKKLFSIKNLFSLSFQVKSHFFKTFLLPHFDYCASLFIHFNQTQIEKINKIYNLCLYVLLKIELNHLSLEDQQSKLKPLNILPFRYRLLFRFSIFSYKIVNKFILNNIFSLLKPNESVANTRKTSSNLYDVPIVVSNKGSRRISIVLANTMNKVLKTYTNLSFKDFKEAVLSSLSLLYIKFSKFILKDS